MTTIAIIGGSGLHEMPQLSDKKEVFNETPWGMPSAPLEVGFIGKTKVVFLSRHGMSVRYPPHMINYRANLWAINQLSPDFVVGFGSVGCISPEDKPGMLAIPDQLIDYTWGRESSYNCGDSETIVHIDFTNPFDEKVRELLLDASGALSYPIIDGGVYGVTQGPRLETASEVDRMARDGVHYIGMTLMPEACLARELNLPYAMICQIVNHAAGRQTSEECIDFTNLSEILERTTKQSLEIVLKASEDLNIDELK